MLRAHPQRGDNRRGRDYLWAASAAKSEVKHQHDDDHSDSQGPQRRIRVSLRHGRRPQYADARAAHEKIQRAQRRAQATGVPCRDSRDWKRDRCCRSCRWGWRRLRYSDGVSHRRGSARHGSGGIAVRWIGRSSLRLPWRVGRWPWRVGRWRGDGHGRPWQRLGRRVRHRGVRRPGRCGLLGPSGESKGCPTPGAKACTRAIPGDRYHRPCPMPT
jgi:hypothetical protein